MTNKQLVTNELRTLNKLTMDYGLLCSLDIEIKEYGKVFELVHHIDKPHPFNPHTLSRFIAFWKNRKWFDTSVEERKILQTEMSKKISEKRGYLDTSADDHFIRLYSRYIEEVSIPFFKPEVVVNAMITGSSQWEMVKGWPIKEIFEMYGKNNDLLKTFIQVFYLSRPSVVENIARNIKSIKPHHSVMDIGGGIGHLASELFSIIPLNKIPDIYETEVGKADIEECSLKHFPDQNFRMIYGDFFDKTTDFLPNAGEKKYDILILNSILHDWHDDRCTVILNKCFNHLKPEGRLLVIESDMSTNFAPGYDMQMLITANGVERDMGEYEELFAKSNLLIDNTMTVEDKCKRLTNTPRKALTLTEIPSLSPG